MAMTMRERIAAACGGFQDERAWRARPESVRDAYLHAADAVLSELLTPTDGMVADGAIGLLRAQDYDIERLDQYEHAPDMHVTKVEFENAFHAAILAAKEGK